MIEQVREKVKRHIKTHSERSVEDRSAIALLGAFLNPGGRINTSFEANDTWPNHDGTFEFVSNPIVSRRPTQNFIVQIKGTHLYSEKDNAEKITHGVFYTAITRAKTNLKIYWSSETMQEVVKGFAINEMKKKSLEIVKSKLAEE